VATATALSQEKKSLETTVSVIDSLQEEIEDALALVDFALENKDAQGFTELQKNAAEMEQQLAKLEFKRMFRRETDHNNCFID